MNLKLGSIYVLKVKKINEIGYLVGSLTKLSYRMYYFMLTVNVNRIKHRKLHCYR